MNRRTLVPNLLWSLDAPITAKNGDERNVFWIAAVVVPDIAGSGSGKKRFLMSYGG
jgi:hypothetical protein